MPTVITTANSQSGTGHLVTLEALKADSFTINPGAFLISDSSPLLLIGPAAWKVTINGQVLSTNAGVGTTFAMLLGAGAASKLAIGTEGSIAASGVNGYGLWAVRDIAVVNKGLISGGICGVVFHGGNNSINNAGEIKGLRAIGSNNGTSNETVTNSGKITGQIALGDGTNKLTNSGIITIDPASGINSSAITFGNGNDTFDNKAKGLTIDNVILGDGINTVKNAGVIGLRYAEFQVNPTDFAIIGGAAGIDNITNAKSGGIGAGLNLGGGTNVFTNSGQVFTTDVGGAKISYYGGEDSTDIVNNKKGGIIHGVVNLGEGTNSLTNAATIGNPALSSGFLTVIGGSGVDTIKNSGTINGSVNLFEGNDVFTNTGRVIGYIDMGGGNDTYKGSKNFDLVADGAGQDSYVLGDGNDSFTSFGGESDLTDNIDAGKGTDTYFHENQSRLRINLDTVSHTMAGWTGLNGAIAASTATNSANPGVDNIKGFENASGAGDSDIIFGSSAANVLFGNSSEDELWGFAGNDFIYGGGEGDYIVGGAGKDDLRGDSGADRFVYTSIAESGLTIANADVILDFEDGQDRIDLSLIDADSRTAVNDSFILLGTTGVFTAGIAASLQIISTATGYKILGETTGDGKADFSISINDADHSVVWGINDFLT